MRLHGRTAIVTGAAHGIGRATAERFAQEGASVIIADVDTRRGPVAAADIRDNGGTVEFLHVDIADASSVDEMIAFACQRYGSLDILHNNAFVLGEGRAGEVSAEDWHRTMNVCLHGYWACTKAALAPMVEQRRGVIINTGSVAGLAADYNLAAYSTAKAAIINLTRVTAIDYARKGIRCNAICPGPVWTRAQAHLEQLLSEPPLPPDSVWPPPVRAMQDGLPMGRLGRPVEVANLAAFLASDDSSYMTGATCVIDGGMFAQVGPRTFAGSRADW